MCCTCDTRVDPRVGCADLLNLHVSSWCYGEVGQANQGLSVLQPLDVTLSEVAGWTAEHHGCPRKKVGVTSYDQMYLFGFLPLDIHLPLCQDGRI